MSVTVYLFPKGYCLHQSGQNRLFRSSPLDSATIPRMATTTCFHTPIMTVEEFLAWIDHRRYRETVAVIADSLGANPISVWDWIAGRRRPSRQTRKLASFLSGQSRELDPGLPLMPRGPYRPRKPNVFEPHSQSVPRAFSALYSCGGSEQGPLERNVFDPFPFTLNRLTCFAVTFV